MSKEGLSTTQAQHQVIDAMEFVRLVPSNALLYY